MIWQEKKKNLFYTGSKDSRQRQPTNSPAGHVPPEFDFCGQEWFGSAVIRH